MTGYDRLMEIIVIDNDLSLKEAAARIGINEMSFTWWKRDKCAPKSTFILMAFCDEFNISADWLLFGIGKKERE